MKILVLDNYDSFTYNLVYILRRLGMGSALTIVRNDHITVREAGAFDKILLSPGPGIPGEAGIMNEVIRTYGPEKSILGVCLGHQGIGEMFGGTLYNMPVVRHGITTTVRVTRQDYLFEHVPESFTACLYHSWAIRPESVNGQFEVTALDSHDTIMAIRHQHWDVRGLQFHPESILTEGGEQLIKNWLENGNERHS